MTKESVSVLEKIIELSNYGLKVVGAIFVVVGILLNVFLGLIIIGKLYGAEMALSIAEVVQIIFNGIFYTALIISIFGIVAMIIKSLIKYNEKFKEKKKKEFEEFMNGVIKKSRRNK